MYVCMHACMYVCMYVYLQISKNGNWYNTAIICVKDQAWLSF